MLNVKDGNNQLQVLNTTIDGNGQHTPHNIIDSAVLPTGAATDTSLQAILAEITALATAAVGTNVNVTVGASPSSGLASQTTLASVLSAIQALATAVQVQPVSATALPLPTGAATQTTLASVLSAVQLLATQTTAAQIANYLADLFIPPASQAFTATSNITGTGATTVIAAPTGGKNIVVTSLVIGNSSTATWVNIASGSNTISVYVNTNASLSVNLPALSGFPGAVNTAVTATCETNSASLRVSAGYFIALNGVPQ